MRPCRLTRLWWCLWLLLFGTGLLAAPVVTGQLVWSVGLEQATAVAVTMTGQVYVLDGVNRRVQVLAANGTLSRTLEPGLTNALDIGVSDGEGEGVLWIADTGNHRLLRLDPGSGHAEAWPLNYANEANPPAGQPEPVAVTVIDDWLYWADRNTHRICRLRWKTGAGSGCFGGRGEGDGQFQYPWQMAVDRDGYLYVTDILNARIQVFDKSGRYFSRIGRFGLSDGELFRPTGIALDKTRDRLYISDAYLGTISVFERGEFLGRLQDGEGKPARFDTPSGLAFHDDTLYVAETGASRVIRLSLAETAVAAHPSPDSSVSLSQKNCILCHLSWAGDAPASIRDKDADGLLPEASFRMCYSCHQGPVMDSRTRIHRAAQHPTRYESVRERKRHARQGPRQDKLAKDFPLDEHQRLTCTSCHTPHTDTHSPETLYAGHGNAWLRVPNRGGDLCERCHASKGKAARPDTPDALQGRNHPLGLHLSRPPFNQARGYASQPELQQGLPEALRQHGAVTGSNDSLICQSCHQIHGGYGDGVLTVLPDDHAQLCAACHDRQQANGREEAHRKGVHPVNFKPDKPFEWRGQMISEITCNTCHPVHQGTVGTALLPEGTARAEALCQGCHLRQHAENREQARYRGIHPVNVTLDEPVTLNGQSQTVVTCLSCHAVHRGQPNTAALVETDRNGELCSHCHGHKQTVVGTDHDLRITGKTVKNAYDRLPTESGVCGACHTLHRGKGDQPALSAVRRVDSTPEPGAEKTDQTLFQRDKLCLNCHQNAGPGSKKTIRHFSHPHDGLILRSTDKTMPLLDAHEQNSSLGHIACVTCHEPHVFDPRQQAAKPVIKMELSTHQENREGTHSDSFLRHKGVTGTFCIDCHGQEGLMKYQYFHDAQRARGKGWEEAVRDD